MLPASVTTVLVTNRVLDFLGVFLIGVFARMSGGMQLPGNLMYAVLVIAAPMYLGVYAGGRTAPSHHFTTGVVLSVLGGLVGVAVLVLMYLLAPEVSTAVFGAAGVILSLVVMSLACGQLKKFEEHPRQ